jgi:hypothetical protein
VDPFDICPCELEEVPFLSKHPRALVVDVEKGLKVVEIVCTAHLFDRFVRERDVVSLLELEHVLRFERTFDVEMELDLGDSANELFHSTQMLGG